VVTDRRFERQCGSTVPTDVQMGQQARWNEMIGSLSSLVSDLTDEQITKWVI
jgi:hypothetical protein